MESRHGRKMTNRKGFKSRAVKHRCPVCGHIKALKRACPRSGR